jgi:hypothetical protein
MNKIFRLLTMVMVSAASGLFATELTLDFVSPGNNPIGFYYVSPYTAEIKGTGQLLTLYCIDFDHEIAPPEEWTARIESFDFANLPNMQNGGGSNPSATWLRYEAAAWLIPQLAQEPNDAQGLYQQAIYQYAAWEVFLDAAHTASFEASEVAAGGNTFVGQVTAAYNDALAAASNGFNLSGWDIVTGIPAGQSNSPQEFLVRDSAPEPSSLILLATVLGALAFLAIRSNASSALKAEPGKKRSQT